MFNLNSFFDDFDRIFNDFMKNHENIDHTWTNKSNYYFYGFINGKEVSPEEFKKELNKIYDRQNDGLLDKTSHSVSDEMAKIDRAITQAVKEENYEEAARLKKQLDALKESKNEILKLDKQLEEALAVQDYEKAAELKKERDKLLKATIQA